VIGVVVVATWLAAVAPLSAGEFNSARNIGDAAPVWKDLPGVDGRKHSLSDLKDRQVVVVVFTCNSCEIAQAYEDRIIDFASKHAGPNDPVAVVAINVNTIPKDRLPQMKERAEAKHFPFPYLYDQTQRIAREYGANFTPEFFVLDRDRKIVYMGGFDDNSEPEKVTKHYLEPAVAAVLKGEKPVTAETPARGCRIRYERERRRKPTG
jgi:peroxiredoxin